LKRKRGQRGHVRIESGSWIGYFNIYILDESTQESKRKQRSIKLGPAEGRGKLSKWDAYEELAKVIERETGGISNARPDGSITLENFTKTRWRPLREADWRPSSKASADYILGHIYKKFGSVPLKSLDKVELQGWLNHLAEKHAKSLVLHARHYLKSILEEAVEQDYLLKNPAKKLKTPVTKRVDKSVLTAEQFRAVLAELDEMYQLLVKVAIACAFRPGELLALRWRDLDVAARTFTIHETVYEGKLRSYTKTTKEGETDTSLLTVPVPDALVQALVDYRGLKLSEVKHLKKPERKDFSTNKEYVQALKNLLPKLKLHGEDEDFIFHGGSGKPLSPHNIAFRIFKPVKKKLGLPVLSFQVLRRSAATFAQSHGGVKDTQALLRHRSPQLSFTEYVQAQTESTRKMVNSVFNELMASAAEA
jgi:integrase